MPIPLPSKPNRQFSQFLLDHSDRCGSCWIGSQDLSLFLSLSHGIPPVYVEVCLFVLTSLIHLWGYHVDPNICSLRVARLLLNIDIYMRNCQHNSRCNCVRACYVICYVTVYVPYYVTVIRVFGSGTNEGLSPRSGRGRPPSLVPTHWYKVQCRGTSVLFSTTISVFPYCT